MTSTDFANETFCPRSWVNDACRERPKDTPLDTYVAQLEMQLQLRCEEVEAEMEATTAKLSHQIPIVLQEAQKIESEMMGLHAALGSTVATLNKRSAQAAEAVSGIKELHKIKSNMQSACASLKEATELSELFVRVDAVFSSGDIFAMAKIMSTMHRSLKLVGNVPEFKSGTAKLKSLEENLVSSVEAKLATAILEKHDEVIKKLAEILVSLDRGTAVGRTYVSVKQQETKPLIKSLNEMLVAETDEGADHVVLENVQSWHHTLLYKVQEELEWCHSLFGAQGPIFLLSSLQTLLEDYNPGLADAVGRTTVQGTLLIQAATLDFCLALKQMLEPLVGEASMEVLICEALKPTEKQVAAFPLLKRRAMLGVIDELTPSLSEPSLIEGTLQTFLQLSEKAVHWCLELTGGTEIVGLESEMHTCWLSYVQRQTAVLWQIRGAALPAQSEEPQNVHDVLHLLKVGTQLEKALHQLSSAFADAKSQIAAVLKRELLPVDLVRLRLKRDSRKNEDLQSFLQRTEWRGQASVRQAIEGFSAAAEALVFDVLMHKPRFIFRGHIFGLEMSLVLGVGFGKLGEWEQAEATGPIAASLPRFSLYPLSYVSALGEYLMIVPQQLEGLVSGESETDDERLEQKEALASTLLSKVIVGCAELYADEILALKRATPSGVAQLTCDLQYFTNVLSAMGTTLPPPLASVDEALRSTVASLRQRLTEDVDANERTILQTVLKMREAM